MDIQRLRNLTTGKLHTDIAHVYEDIEYLTGEKGIMTHHLPGARRALLPFLKERLPGSKFWDGSHDPGHVGEVYVEPLTVQELEQFWPAFEAEMQEFWTGKFGGETEDQHHET